MKVAPSILSADFTQLGAQIAECEAAGADWIHIDVMDGHFVPNISLGPVIVEAARRATRLPLDVHLMITAPERYLAAFARAGADRLTVHLEACPHLHRTVQQIKQLDKAAGVALNPGTPAAAVSEVLSEVDLLLAMTVNPGFSGQKFIASVLPKIRQLRQMIAAARPEGGVEIQVDGGIDAETAPLVIAAGATVLVAASAIFKANVGIGEAIGRIRESAGN
ncbi:MAG: ribulose-phosphate 3-epimerase [Anaerolineales bacterium]|nr:ribulose-phosphate 3-epimerase [Anaerolineales bacterium]